MANSASGDSMLDRLVRVLESFDTGRPTQTIADLARRADLPLSTAYRFVGELVERGLLERDESGEVRIGMHLWELTTRGSRALELRRLALPSMGRVQARLREHTQLAVLEGDSALFIERLSGASSGANITRVAGRLPLHASSSGLVLLAYAPAEVRERILAGPLLPVADETITDPDQLRRTLAHVRERGHVRALGSIEHHSLGIAVPVDDGSGRVIAALSAVLPREYPNPDAALAVLVRGAKEITAAIAGREGVAN
ncbi:IclR family transcriptional regulator [Gulosibacter macacae]|uniref:IclR family transcriptional regulator n=1 Tax=Gulosibacter macacae TaxID=2488791 RepID=A0A3P3W2X0_9MICO|nr:IclR family transcriptional regulator [Gulosibacter macacae]RRJ88276.1 IclR family transcriptional regulator [Gulosibacter macacae]